MSDHANEQQREIQRQADVVEKVGDNLKPWAYDLWEHMHHEHGLTLMENEIHEIILIAKRVPLAPSEPDTRQTPRTEKLRKNITVAHRDTRETVDELAAVTAERDKMKDAIRRSELQLNTGQDCHDGNEMRVYTAMEWQKAVQEIARLNEELFTARALLDSYVSERDALAAKLDEMKVELEECKHQNGISARERELEDALAEAQKDTERLDWLEANPYALQHSTWVNQDTRCWNFGDQGITIGQCKRSLRAALDAARSTI